MHFYFTKAHFNYIDVVNTWETKYHTEVTKIGTNTHGHATNYWLLPHHKNNLFPIIFSQLFDSVHPLTL